jgi:hypothetical protein
MTPNTDAPGLQSQAESRLARARSLKGTQDHMTRGPMTAHIIEWRALLPGLGVEYTYRSGEREVHAIGASDWSVLHRMHSAGCLFFAKHKLRDAFWAAMSARTAGKSC